MSAHPEHEREIVAVHHEDVGGHHHIAAVELADGTRQTLAEVLAAIDAGDVVYVMVPPEGAPAHEAYMATVRAGTPRKLLIQTRQCPDCADWVIWA